MPHKHTRREKNDEDFELPPTVIAKPLRSTTSKKKTAATEKKNTQHSQNDSPKKEKKRKREADDVPRAFKRIMNLQAGKLPRSGLDNGDEPKGKKGKKKGLETAAAPTPKPASLATNPDLQIRPGEKFSEFNQRVDAALPLSGLITKTTVKDGKDPLGMKVRRTKKERKMHNMYAEWREIDRKAKERREEELEALEEKEMENDEMGISWKLNMEAKSGKKKGKKRARYIGEEAGPEGDPWEEIKKKRGEGKVGLNEVAHAPPELKLPRRNALVLGAKVEVSDIPKAAGSLRQREELQGIRDDVVAQYRKLVETRRQAAANAEE